MAATLTAVLVLLGAPSPAAAQEQPPPTAEEPRRLRLDVTTPETPAITVAPERRSPVTLEVTAPCPTCSTGDRPPITNGNAPYNVSAYLTLGDTENYLRVGVIGQTNARLPLFMATPIGGTAPTQEPASYWTSMADPGTHWQVSIAAERTLFRLSGGQTIGVLGEAFLPLVVKTGPPAPGDTPRPQPKAVRGAFRVRF